MKLTVEHTTNFEYDAPVYESATEARLQPRSNQGSPQHCLDFRLAVYPAAPIFQYTDFYGNNVHHFAVVPNHKSLQIVATSVVETGVGPIAANPEDNLKIYDFLSETRYVRFDRVVQDFAQQFKSIAHPLEKANAICQRINETLIYEPGVTSVHSDSAEVMALGRGVCQDFAQLMIATCRCLGIASRYVSGYYYGGAQVEGQDQASHAWCEVFGGPEIGWIGFDPTHKTLHVDEKYIRIGVGRDYADVPPVRGIYKGAAAERLHVVVRISAAPLLVG